MNQLNQPCTDDAEILRGLAGPPGTEFNRAVGCIEKNCKPGILAWLRKNGIHTELTEDIWRDAFADTWINLCHRGKPLERNLCGYLFAVARNKWRRYWRDKTRPEEPRDILPELPPVEEEEEKIPREYIEACRLGLGQNCRDILDDFDAGFSMEEIAVKYGLKDEHTARQTKYRCQQKFLNCLKLKMGLNEP